MKFPVRMKSTKIHSERKIHMSLTHYIRAFTIKMISKSMENSLGTLVLHQTK